jgi:hypothetical protein
VGFYAQEVGYTHFLALIDAAIECDPQSVYIRRLQADTLATAGRWEDAIQAGREVLKLDPDDS